MRLSSAAVKDIPALHHNVDYVYCPLGPNGSEFFPPIISLFYGGFLLYEEKRHNHFNVVLLNTVS